MKFSLLKKNSIHTKLFMIILVFVCIPLLVLGFFWYGKSTKTIENNAVQNSQHLLAQTNEYLDFYLNDLEQSTVPIVSMSPIQRYLDLSPGSTSRYDRFILDKDIKEEAFSNILEGRSDIFGISLINQFGMQVNNYSQVNHFLNMNQIRNRNQELLEQTEQLDAYQIMNIDFIRDTPVLTVVRKVYDVQTFETSGLLIINLRLNQIDNIINEVTESHFNRVWIVNENHRIIFHPDQTELGQTFDYEENQTESQNFLINQIEDKRTLMVMDRSDQSNWTMIANVPMQAVMTNLMSFRNLTIWIGLALIGVALLFVGGFSFSLTYSLINLQKLMKKAQSGRLKFNKIKPLRLYRNDEVSDLYDSFYNMTEELNRLIEEIHHSKLKEKELEIKNRESELRAMQSQINPHFLYNTLELINSHAIIENQLMISRMTTSLADMFRYNVSNSKKVVTLKEEIQQIRSYLDIQQERFEDLNVVYDVKEEDIKEVLATRITLQPILENAFIHGYEEHGLAPSFIGIYGKRNEFGYSLFIVDHGNGMDETTKDTYNQAFRTNEPSDEKKSTKRIGMNNVHRRLHATFGQPYGLTIERSNEKGTVIVITLPYLTHETKKEA
ncbi:sensor histidine kinase [Halobacillus litoralis]|uniref:cache domain-containing sensor histidine kinase n=1 Tax=Halobacillus litoralis TaxID=45668 RepID=UPI001CFC90AC|nr:sensor histidine kinase [Halobacillus litoralis]WLR49091.1 sensor histidine kinase [Halobacillus litoralis]